MMEASYTFGILSALAGPFVGTIGFYIWENHWKGSAFALNLFKCNVASIGFLVVCLIMAGRDDEKYGFNTVVFAMKPVGYLLLSSTIGILVGDWTWLQALHLLGAKRVILMDSLKPFFAALMGWWILDENLQPAAFGGVALTLGGILVVSLENEGDDEDENRNDSGIGVDANPKGIDNRDANDETYEMGVSSSRTLMVEKQNENDGVQQKPRIDGKNMVCTDEENIIQSPIGNDPDKNATNNKNILVGYIMSVVNIVLDTYGAVLIKQNGPEMSVWQINLIRFGFAGVVMAILSVILVSRDLIGRNTAPNSQSNVHSQQQKQTLGEAGEGHDSREIENEVTSALLPSPWYSLPIREGNGMTKSSWYHVLAGILFVTFLNPVFSNYALFQVALALALTLGSTGPLYSLLISYLIGKNKGKLPSLRSIFGSALAVAGIVVLVLRGTLPGNQ